MTILGPVLRRRLFAIFTFRPVRLSTRGTKRRYKVRTNEMKGTEPRGEVCGKEDVL